jgi:hypothetical protein
MTNLNEYSSRDQRERMLFSALAQAHLVSGGGIGFRSKKWMADADGPTDADGQTFICIDDDHIDVRGAWVQPHQAVEAIMLEVGRERRPLDHVFFYYPSEKGSYDGVTWRMLMIYMSFLRIVLDHDSLTM